MSTCRDNVLKMHDAIIARASGTGVQSSGHKDRNVAFAQVSLESMVKLYQQLRAQCPDASDLPELTELTASVATRGCLNVRLWPR